MYPYLHLWSKWCLRAQNFNDLSSLEFSGLEVIFFSQIYYLQFIILFQKLNFIGAEEGWKLEHKAFKNSTPNICY